MENENKKLKKFNENFMKELEWGGGDGLLVRLGMNRKLSWPQKFNKAFKPSSIESIQRNNYTTTNQRKIF